MSQPLQKKHDKRIIALILLVVIMFVSSSIRVFEYQVVDGTKYLSEVKKNYESKVVTYAARGDIVDRNGVPLTQNKAVFNIEFDYNFLMKGTENQVIFKLIMLLQSKDEEWIDELPITKTTPYEFIDGKEQDVKRLKQNLKLNDYTTAADCMENLFNDCNIYDLKDGNPDFNDSYARLVAGVRYQMILNNFSRWTNRFTFAQDISPQTVAIVREFSNELKGAEVVERAIRTYLSGDVASHLIGSLGPIYAEEMDYYKNLGYKPNEIVGKNGVEKALESELKGTNGEMVIVKNNKGDIISVNETKAPVAGKTVKLTLDLAFQADLQQLLADYLVEFNETNTQKKHAEVASIVVLDVKTGGVLASVSYPYFDINDYFTNYDELLNGENKPLFNRALFGTYRPGSTFKTVVATAGLTENKITPNSTITCTGKYLFYPEPFRPKCLNVGHGVGSRLNVTSALHHSCNIFFYDTGRILGINKINEYSQKMGLGVDTGLELPNAVGNLSGPEFSAKFNARWEAGNVVQAAIGQMDTSVTPLQMAIQASTIANKGTRYKAHLVDSYLSSDQKTVLSKKEPEIASRFEMSDQTYSAITSGMILAAKGIGGVNSIADLGYDVAIKTGTPQVGTNKTNNTFIAFAPVDEPEVAISFMVEDGYATNQFLKRILLAYEKAKLNWE